MSSFYGTAPHSTPAPPTPTKFPQQLVPEQREVWPQRPFILVCAPYAICTTKPARALEVVCAYTTTYYFTGLNQRVWHQLRQQMASAHCSSCSEAAPWNKSRRDCKTPPYKKTTTKHCTTLQKKLESERPHTRTTDAQWSLFFHWNPELLGLGI